MFHARDSLTPSHNRIVAELRCIRWTLQSLKNLRLSDVIIASDCQAVLEALAQPLVWSRYRVIIDQVHRLCSSFDSISWELEALNANNIVREISKSVLRDGRFQSYLALGGPAWLHDRLAQETTY